MLSALTACGKKKSEPAGDNVVKSATDKPADSGGTVESTTDKPTGSDDNAEDLPEPAEDMGSSGSNQLAEDLEAFLPFEEGELIIELPEGWEEDEINDDTIKQYSYTESFGASVFLVKYNVPGGIKDARSLAKHFMDEFNEKDNYTKFYSLTDINIGSFKGARLDGELIFDEDLKETLVHIYFQKNNNIYEISTSCDAEDEEAKDILESFFESVEIR